MNRKAVNRNPRTCGLKSIFISLAVCVFATASPSAGQINTPSSPAQVQQGASDSAPQTANTSSSSSATSDASKVKFSAPHSIFPKLTSGTASAFNLCTGVDVTNTLPAGFTDADGLKMDTANGQCGQSASTVSGGNPPYNFQLDSGSFPPLGMHLGLNGLLYGTPAPPPLGGYKPFRVCAVDLGANSDCQEVKVGPQPTAQAKSGGHTGLIIGATLLGGAAVAGVVAARSLSDSSTSSSSSSSSSGGSCTSLENSCNNLAAECLNDNNASACQQIPSVCTQMCQCEGFSSFNTETGSCQ
jgi:hypothetical protein